MNWLGAGAAAAVVARMPCKQHHQQQHAYGRTAQHSSLSGTAPACLLRSEELLPSTSRQQHTQRLTSWHNRRWKPACTPVCRLLSAATGPLLPAQPQDHSLTAPAGVACTAAGTGQSAGSVASAAGRPLHTARLYSPRLQPQEQQLQQLRQQQQSPLSCKHSAEEVCTVGATKVAGLLGCQKSLHNAPAKNNKNRSSAGALPIPSPPVSLSMRSAVSCQNPSKTSFSS